MRVHVVEPGAFATGFQARAATLAKFKAKAPGAQHHDPLYAACTYDLDDGVGILLKKIKDLVVERIPAKTDEMDRFLSENEGFAQACADAGIAFIGPPASAIAGRPV